MRKAVYAGTFDPLTLGHLDIIRRAASMVDELVVLIASNGTKSHKFSSDERKLMINNVIGNLPNVTVDVSSDLVVRYAQEHNISIMYRGLRNFQDYEYEYALSKYNSNINSKIETVLLFPSSYNHFVSSSGIKELVLHNADISLYVPVENIQLVINKFSR